jgi:hypothetical protein
MNKVTGTCADECCDLPAVTRIGFCLKHYKRWKRRGTTHDVTAEERFFSYVASVEAWDACWKWTNSLGAGGYGRFWVGQVNHLAHRWSYEFFRVSIPSGLCLDHLCSTPQCVNPWHLEPVTQQENLHRSSNHVGVNARKTHCLRGHAFDEANTYWTRRGRRHCRACQRIRERK